MEAGRSIIDRLRGGVIPEDAPDASIFSPKHITRLLAAAVILISCVIFGLAGNAIHWPTEYHYQGSLIQPVAAMAIVVAVLLLAVCAAIGTLVLSRRYFLGGLMTATAGLTVWAARGGTTTYVLFRAQDGGADRRIFLSLLVELIVLCGAVGGIWNALWFLRPTYMLKPVEQKERESRSTGPALLTQAALMAIFMMILVVTPLKKQVLTGTFVAGVFSTALAEYFFAERATARWYWVAPLAVGVVGYVAGFFMPAGFETGDLAGMFSPLSRALPLDYASLGMTGVLVGYWWMMPHGIDTPEDDAKGAPSTPGQARDSGTAPASGTDSRTRAR